MDVELGGFVVAPVGGLEFVNVHGPCVARIIDDSEIFVGKEYTLKEWNNVDNTRVAFVKGGEIKAFIIYRRDYAFNKGRTRVDWAIKVACAAPDAPRSTSAREVSMMKFLLSYIMHELEAATYPDKVTERRLQLDALGGAYHFWWYMGFRHPNSQKKLHRHVQASRPDKEVPGGQLKPMYLWVTDETGSVRSLAKQTFEVENFADWKSHVNDASYGAPGSVKTSDVEAIQSIYMGGPLGTSFSDSMPANERAEAYFPGLSLIHI